MTVVERLARASYESLAESHRLPPWEKALPHVQDVHRRSVRAILRELREPSSAMVEAGIRASVVAMLPSELARVHAAMVDKALEE